MISTNKRKFDNTELAQTNGVSTAKYRQTISPEEELQMLCVKNDVLSIRPLLYQHPRLAHTLIQQRPDIANHLEQQVTQCLEKLTLS